MGCRPAMVNKKRKKEKEMKKKRMKEMKNVSFSFDAYLRFSCILLKMEKKNSF